MNRITLAIILTLACAINPVQAAGQTAFSGAGVIESRAGGFKFPDGSVQLSAITPPCTVITYLPYTISSEGVYCFSGNLSTSMTAGDAISINADNVVIDMNGWKLDGLDAGTETLAKGIFALQRKNITIRNGTISGFRVGIHIEDSDPYTISQAHLIEQIRVDRNTIQGIVIDGIGNIVRNNHVVATGGGTSPGIAGRAFGIWMRGTGARIINNDIINTTATNTGEGYGIAIGGSDGSVVEANRIEGLSSDAATNYGLLINNSSNVLVVGNRITTAINGIVFTDSDGKYRDNLTSNVSTPYTGGTDSGGND
jgi:hypothetical protein